MTHRVEDRPDAYMPAVWAAQRYYRWYRRLWRQMKKQNHREVIMCEKCKQAVDLVMDKLGYTDKQAMDVLWSETAFPAADGNFVLKQVKAFIKKQKARKP